MTIKGHTTPCFTGWPFVFVRSFLGQDHKDDLAAVPDSPSEGEGDRAHDHKVKSLELGQLRWAGITPNPLVAHVAGMLLQILP